MTTYLVWDSQAQRVFIDHKPTASAVALSFTASDKSALQKAFAELLLIVMPEHRPIARALFRNRFELSMQVRAENNKVKTDDFLPREMQISDLQATPELDTIAFEVFLRSEFAAHAANAKLYWHNKTTRHVAISTYPVRGSRGHFRWAWITANFSLV